MTNLPKDQPSKEEFRNYARLLRRQLDGKAWRSEKIADALRGLPEYASAQTVMFYVNTANEVRTRPLIEESLQQGRCVVVPYCCGKDMALFRLQDMSELAPVAFGIDEPLPALRELPERAVDRESIGLIIVPGVAFDPARNRIGQGGGFYDRFLKTFKKRPYLAALSYQCQIFSSIPTDPHDIQMDAVVTEERVYRDT